MEVGIPVNSAESKNTELVPKIFNDLKVGENFTLQTLLGYSTLLGGGADGGLQTFEYAFVLGYSISHRKLPLPGVQQFIPMFELKGETPMNKDAPGRNSLLGNASFRVNLNTIGRDQPRRGLGFVFPINDNAKADVHWGIFTSLVCLNIECVMLHEDKSQTVFDPERGRGRGVQNCERGRQGRLRRGTNCKCRPGQQLRRRRSLQ